MPDRQAAGHARATEAVGDLVTRADLAQLEVRLVRILLIQTGVIIGAVVALLRLIP